MDNKEVLEKLIEMIGWDGVFGFLMDIAFEKDEPEIYCELDNIQVNIING